MRTSIIFSGLCGLGLGLCGCESGGGDYEEYTPPPVSEDDHDHDHDHHHAEFGPHDGHIIELGDHEYHAEIVFDADSKAVTVYLFGHELDEPLPVELADLPLTLAIEGDDQTFSLKAVPLEGEAEGTSSRFSLIDDATIAEHIGDAEDLHGHIEVTIAGKPYKGEITHDHDHGHDHGHDHDDDHDDGHDHDHDGDDHDHAEEDGEHAGEDQPE